MRDESGMETNEAPLQMHRFSDPMAPGQAPLHFCCGERPTVPAGVVCTLTFVNLSRCVVFMDKSLECKSAKADTRR